MLRLFGISLFFCCSFACAKAADFTQISRDTILPTVFRIGEYEAVYDELLIEYETLLLSACDHSMTDAFNKWKSMLLDMEKYSEDVGYDLKGTKLWVNVFWNADGTIRHFAYYLKPVSRNLDLQELNAFLESFVRYYRFPLEHHTQYSHYGTAMFPLLPNKHLKKRYKK